MASGNFPLAVICARRYMRRADAARGQRGQRSSLTPIRLPPSCGSNRLVVHHRALIGGIAEAAINNRAKRATSSEELVGSKRFLPEKPAYRHYQDPCVQSEPTRSKRLSTSQSTTRRALGIWSRLRHRPTSKLSIDRESRTQLCMRVGRAKRARPYGPNFDPKLLEGTPVIQRGLVSHSLSTAGRKMSTNQNWRKRYGH